MQLLLLFRAIKAVGWNFIIPNFFSIAKKKIRFGRIPWCNQLVLITGKGTVEMGKGCNFGFKSGGFYRGGCIEIQSRFPTAIIKLGDQVSTNNNVFFCAANYIEIGNNTLIGERVTIMDFEAHRLDPNSRRKIGKIGKVIIGRNVWIGSNVMVLKNTEIGENSIVAAGAVVSGSFPENVIIGGVPAKIIKRIE